MLPRASGQREDRYMHLLCGEVDGAALAAKYASSSGSSDAADPGLAERVAQLGGRGRAAGTAGRTARLTYWGRIPQGGL